MTAGTPRESGIAIVDRQLTIDGAAFLVLGAELHNSSSADEAILDAKLARLVDLGVNTVLAPISWELFEPREGEFDYRHVDVVLETVRSHRLRLVPLWFGSWKNGMSSY